jgi:hypothetical protein
MSVINSSVQSGVSVFTLIFAHVTILPKNVVKNLALSILHGSILKVTSGHHLMNY